MKRLKTLSLIVFASIIACSKKEQPVPVAPEGERYLNEILAIMEKNSVNRKTIDWPSFKSAVFQKAPDPIDIAHTVQAITFALAELKDHHSYYVFADGNRTLYDTQFCVWWTNPPDVSPLPPPTIGYVRIPGINDGSAGDAAILFAQSMQSTIKSQDKAGLKGWLVDLRGNSGGNMWPMLAGIGPVLGEGIAGYFIDPDNVISSYGYKNGTSILNDEGQLSVANSYSLIFPNPKVAVLIDAASSSGEAVAIAFVGRPNTRLFGATGSCGYTTACFPFKLFDGATLGIADAVMADRNKNKFGGQILPDEINKDDASAVAAALQWLSN